jgi:hypothetical protein
VTDATAVEQELLRDTLDGLALAVTRSDELDAGSLEMTSDTKLEKFLYEALSETGALGEVTHSWYLAGAKTAATDGTPTTDRLQNAYDRVARPPRQSSSFSDERRTYDPSERVVRFADFFEQQYEIDDRWFTSGGEFLLEFYRRRAPDRFRRLYVSVQQLRNLLSEMDRELYRLSSATGQETTLADFGQGVTPNGPDHYDELTTLVSRIHVELAGDEALSAVLSEFRAFTDLLEDVFLAVSEMSVDRISADQSSAFKSLKRFQFYEAWRLPALVISRETAAGPNGDRLRQERDRTLERERRAFPDRLAEQREACAAAALSPTTADYDTTLADDTTADKFLQRCLSRR